MYSAKNVCLQQNLYLAFSDCFEKGFVFLATSEQASAALNRSAWNLKIYFK
jgi:hypothetical protein